MDQDRANEKGTDMTGLLVITGFIALIGIVAAYAGTDTRDGGDWKPRFEPWPVLEWGPDDRPPHETAPGPGGGLRGIDGGAGPAPAPRSPRGSGTVGEAA
jgi:hypothetical protein